MSSNNKILIVDDDKSIRLTMRGILRKEGYNVNVVENGYKALDELKNNSYDLALLDIKMPGINGVETFKEIKKISPETTVILMTAYAVEDLVQEALSEGAYTVLNKPLDMEKLINTISRIKKKKMVLIVDDEIGIRTSLSLNLEEGGLRVISAEDGKKAIDIISRKPADIVLMDIKLPDMDGIETIKKIREILPEGDMPEIIMMSGYDVNGKVKQAYSLGAKKFFKKPIDIEELKEEIENLVKKKKKETSSKESPSILVVDDETSTLEMLSSLLKESGYNVKIASNGKKAVDHIKEGFYNIILLDIKLPDTDGFELQKKIKEMQPEAGIIMMTAYTKDDKVKKEIKKGNFNILFKPFDVEKLLESIKEIAESKNR
ncbi:MAG: response regulator [Elusimicrobiota bacterium]